MIKIRIISRLESISNWDISINHRAKVKDVKEIVSNSVVLKTSDILLSHGNVYLMDDSQTLIDYAIRDGSRVLLDFMREKISVTVLLLEKKSIVVETSPHSTVADLADQIRDQLGLTHCGITVMWRAEKLKNESATLISLGIYDADAVCAVEKMIDSFFRLLVESERGEEKEVWFCPGHTVEAATQEIAVLFGCQGSGAWLTFKDRSLQAEAGRTLRQSGVGVGSMHYLHTTDHRYQAKPSKRGSIQIFAKTRDDGKFMAFDVIKNETILSMKKKIQLKICLASDEQELLFQEAFLEDEKTVDEYQIVDKSVIDAIARLRGSIQIFANTVDGRTVTFEIRKNEIIAAMKRKIQDKIGVAPDEQKLVFHGRILEDEKTLEEYQIVDNSTVHVVVRLRNIMLIFVKTLDGKTVVIEIMKNETIGAMKRKIQDKIGVAPDEQKLVFHRGILEDEKTLEEYQIVDKSVVNVVVRRRNGMLIFVKTLEGKTVVIEIMKNETIGAMKKKIQEKVGLAPDEQKLVFQGGILEDEKTVEEYQIADKSVINVVARLR